MNEHPLTQRDREPKMWMSGDVGDALMAFALKTTDRVRRENRLYEDGDSILLPGQSGEREIYPCGSGRRIIGENICIDPAASRRHAASCLAACLFYISFRCNASVK